MGYLGHSINVIEEEQLKPVPVSTSQNFLDNGIKQSRLDNIDNVIIGNLNINSLSAKFDGLITYIQDTFDILVLTETKLDNTFYSSQFFIDGFSDPYRLDRNRNGGGIIIYVREDIRSKNLVRHKIPSDIECLFIELNLGKVSG